MNYFLLAYWIISSTVPYYLNSSELYFLLSNISFVVIICYSYLKTEKSTLNFALFLVLFEIYLVDSFLWACEMIEINDIEAPTYSVIAVILLLIFIAYFKNKWDWKKLPTETYDKNKLQAVYSKPGDFPTLLGSLIYFDPKGSVKYTYGGKVIRFKRGEKFPVLQDFKPKENDKIQTIKGSKEYFYKRYDEIKHKKYNLFSFNCRNLFIWN